jgi:glycosyltransferase involved in cell wall biosynthesis
MTKPIIAVSVNAAWNLVNFRQSLLRGLTAAGYRVVAIAPRDGREDGLAALGVEFEPIEIDARGMSPLGDARLLLAYIRILRRLRPAVYLGYTIKPNVYGGMACQILGIPRIANIAGLGTAFLAAGLLNRTVRALYSIGLRRAERVFFQNGNDLEQFARQKLVDPAHTDLLPGSGVDLARFTPEAREPDGKIVFLVVTRLLRAKGVAEFVDAAAMLRRQFGGAVVFRILGIRDHSAGGVDKATLQQWRDGDDIELVDATSDVRPVVAAADCVVLPSYYPEGTPRSLLEALAMGKAIITTDTPGCRDVVDQGKNGYLCAPRDVSSLGDAMTHYATATPAARRAMSVHSREIAETRYDEAFVVAKYLAVIRAIIARNAPTGGTRSPRPADLVNSGGTKTAVGTSPRDGAD